MKKIKRINSLRIFLWLMFGMMIMNVIMLMLTNQGNSTDNAGWLAASLISMWAIWFVNTFLKKKERSALAKSVLKLVSSTLKQDGVRKFSLNCEIMERKNNMIFEIYIEDHIPMDVYLKCQENVVSYLEEYGSMKRKIIEVNIRQYQSLVIGDFEG